MKKDERLKIGMSGFRYKSEIEAFLTNISTVVEKNLSEPEFNIVVFAQCMNVSKSSLYRKVKSITGLSPVEYVRNARLKHASRLLKNDPITITEVAYTVGFSEPKYFSICFKEEYGVTPTEYRIREGFL